MNTCIELKDTAFPIKVEQRADKRFVVTYGLQVKRGLSYEQAAHAFGTAVFHALACDDKLDSGL